MSGTSSFVQLGKTVANHAHFVQGLRDDELKGLNVLFINMPLRESARPNVAPEGPAILAARLKSFGAQTSILDLNSYRIVDADAIVRNLPYGRHLTYDEAARYLEDHVNKFGTPHMVAFSGIITTLRWQEEMAKAVKKRIPDCFLVSGNGLATEIKSGLFNWIPELDAIGRSEGDDIILKIAHDAIARQNGRKVFQGTKVGEIDGNPKLLYEGARPNELDSLPYADWSLLQEDVYGTNILEQYLSVPVWGLAANNSSATPFSMTRSLTTVSSRGCPYACAFCYRGAMGERNYGMRSAENVAAQMKYYIDEYGVDFIGFVDDNFAVDKRRIAKLPEVFKSYGADIRWGTHTRMDEADERAYQMAEAGCIYIGFGAESAHETILTRMKKGGFILRGGLVETIVRGRSYQFPKTMVDAVLNCHEAAIHANCTWIAGYPGETLEQLQTSVAFITWQQDIIDTGKIINNNGYTNSRDAINRKMFTATAYPGTAMFKDPYVRKQLTEHFGITYDDNGDPLCDENFHHYVLELDDATKVLASKDGHYLNFSAMTDKKFMKTRDLINADEVEKILEL